MHTVQALYMHMYIRCMYMHMHMTCTRHVHVHVHAYCVGAAVRVPWPGVIYDTNVRTYLRTHVPRCVDKESATMLNHELTSHCNALLCRRNPPQLPPNELECVPWAPPLGRMPRGTIG